MRTALQFVSRGARASVRGSGAYYLWLGFLLLLVVLGAVAYGHQLRRGLVVTNMTDQVSWGFYIGNFTFLVGTAAAAVMIVIPAFAYRQRALREVVVLGELMAVVTVAMCLVFVVVDLGQPARLWHMLPLFGRPNFPASVMTWDVVALTGYLLLNAFLSAHVLYATFRGSAPGGRGYRALVWVAIPWAISIHTVTAFIYSGLGARPYWHAAVLAPHFLASAFAAGPALLIAVLLAVRRHLALPVDDLAIRRLRQIAAVAMLVNLFLFGAEVFTELYAQTAHAASMRYHLFGLPGQRLPAALTWAAVALDALAVVGLMALRPQRQRGLLAGACWCAVVGVWMEKGLGLVVPGLVPTPLGEVAGYTPSATELCVGAGIWAGGALLYSLLVKGAAAIQSGELRAILLRPRIVAPRDDSGLREAPETGVGVGAPTPRQPAA
ncbi:MAG: polysulfide reductase NrfD [Deltaproteobacteria bacterium]|nr:polysulfide reductase NrfD [Deltaproteobacteria bacterium]